MPVREKVITGLVPVIHVYIDSHQNVDGRVEPGHDKRKSAARYLLT
jgi:hypothetical protein